MARATLSQQLAAAKREIDTLKSWVNTCDTTISQLTFENRLLRVNERRFDTLLEGMCMGMREANLPRRPV